MLGVYVHVPFCETKCPYCDFYSLTGTSDEDKDRYVQAVLHTADAYRGQSADTVYFGGGTPSLLGAERIAALLSGLRKCFTVTDDAEITIEANPADDLADVMTAFSAAGGNRVSLGMQSGDDEGLGRLGRRHTTAQVDAAVQAVFSAGIRNLSLDLMLGTPHQTEQDVKNAVTRCTQLGANHVSAYLLKLEPDTPFGKRPPALPSEDETVALYHVAAEQLEAAGFVQYEISNFAKEGYRSRHNQKYWNLDPYIGIGPAAHSFFEGKRFYYPRSLVDFIDGKPPIYETADETIPENSPIEYAMLRLRLTEGLTACDFERRFGIPLPTEWVTRARSFPSSLVISDDNGIRLTREGFLVSDALIARILL